MKILCFGVIQSDVSLNLVGFDANDSKESVTDVCSTVFWTIKIKCSDFETAIVTLDKSVLDDQTTVLVFTFLCSICDKGFQWKVSSL